MVPENLAEAGHLAKLTKRLREAPRQARFAAGQSGIDRTQLEPTLDPYFIRIAPTEFTP